jgi:predicted RNase H-like HicB family nuclease
MSATTRKLHQLEGLPFTVRVFKEGETYVAHVPELDVSSCGDTAQAARKNINDAVLLFLESAADMGTLDDILEEAGYRLKGQTWQAPELVSLDRFTLSVT